MRSMDPNGCDGYGFVSFDYTCVMTIVCPESEAKNIDWLYRRFINNEQHPSRYWSVSLNKTRRKKTKMEIIIGNRTDYIRESDIDIAQAKAADFYNNASRIINRFQLDYPEITISLNTPRVR